MVGVLVLLVVLGGLCVGYGVQQSVVRDTSFVSADDLAYEYAGQVGQIAYLSGTVVETNPVVISAEYDYYAEGERHTGTLRLTIHEVSRPVTEGQRLSVYAVVRPNNELIARNEHVVRPGNTWFMYTVSALAGVWVFRRLVQGWRVDRRTLSLRPRSAYNSQGDS